MNKNVKKILLYGTAGAVLSSVGAASSDMGKAYASSFFEDAFQDEDYNSNLGDYQLVETDNVYYKDSDVLEGYQFVTQSDLDAIKARLGASSKSDNSQVIELDKDSDSQTIYLDEDEEQTVYVDEDNYNDDFYCFTSTDFYNTLVDAKKKYDSLLKNGKVSEQIINNGTNLSKKEKKYIDSSIDYIYENISKYIKAFKKKNYDSCYKYGVNLYNTYYDTFGYDQVCKLLVLNNLPSKYQSNIAYQDDNGTYKLDNGKTIRLIGYDNDKLLSSNKYSNDLYEDALLKMEWFKKLPKMITNKYSYIKNNYLDDDDCFIWNETYVENTCSDLLNGIVNEDSKYFDFNKDRVVISWDDDYNSYLYIDDNNNIRGYLSDENNKTIDDLVIIQDAIDTHEANVYEVDVAFRNISSKKEKSYSK